jgi:hypothetical protein
MSLGLAIVLVVFGGGALLIGFCCSMYQQRQRRLEIKSKWSATPPAGDRRGRY